MYMVRVPNKFAIMLLVATVSCLAQTDSKQVFAYKPNQHARLQHIELRSTADRSDSLNVLIEAAFHDPDICCGKQSALRSDLEHLITDSLQGVGNRLKGRHVVKDGRWISVEAKYLPESSINAVALVEPVLQDERVVVEWNHRLYLLKAVSFDETRFTDGSSDYVITQMTLLDPQSKAKNHEVLFVRQKNEWSNIGLLRLTVMKDTNP
jgi:hypothetical protein